MTFDSIINRGEYFSDHYLDTLLQASLKTLRSRWDAAEGKDQLTPRTRLRGMSRAFSTARARATEGGDTAGVHRLALEALGFPPAETDFEIERAGKVLQVPLAATVVQPTGTYLVALSLENCDDLDDLLAKKVAVPHTQGVPIDDVVSSIFAAEDAPRFVLLCGGGMYALADRFSWGEGKLLAVDLSLALERNDTKPSGELATVAALFSADALVPFDGTAQIDEFKDASLKHAVGVSKELREGIRHSVELIANDVITGLRAKRQGVFNDSTLAKRLTTESLRFLYRLLFLLFAESRRELGILPVDAPEYGEGYGLDRLRDLALTKLTTERAQQGSHIYDSLALLFKLVNDGLGDAQQGQLNVYDDEEHHALLEFRPLKSSLFSPDATPTIDSVGLRNHTLQQVLQLLMLSKEQRGRDRGFVSYAQLGINQLGAVYEGLMAYTGFFADEDLIELHQPGKEDKGTWVAPTTKIAEYPDECVKKVDSEVTGLPEPLIHPKGSFVFRLSGRDRQRSASYYTPEVLTRCVVKHSLAELLDQNGEITPAEQLLSLTICEPALGSGAFMNEAINQIAAEYLRRRQHEVGKDIDPATYLDELQKVKAHLALHQCYGVDLNRTAVELAEVSMWLNCMHEGLQAPWFGLHLRRGNSLIGARRAVYTLEELKQKGWADKSAQDRHLANDAVPYGEVHQFLLPAHGWGAAGDAKEAKEFRKNQAEGLRNWRKELLKPLNAKQLDRVDRLARRVEAMWQLVIPTLEAAERGLRRKIDVWGTTAVEAKPLNAAAIDQMIADPNSPLGRLRLVMNAWCAMWFWPLDEQPPSMEQWLTALEGILGKGEGEPPMGQLDLFAGLDEILGSNEQIRFNFDQRLVEDVLAEHEWLIAANDIASREGFWHWELDWAHLFSVGGFDLQVGNPPWVRLNWEDGVVLGEFDPWFGLAEKPAEAELRKRRTEALSGSHRQSQYLRDVVAFAGATSALGSGVLHPVLAGVRSNLYMLFMEAVWMHSSHVGIAGLLHPEGHFTDPRGGALRRTAYARLRRHFQFINEQQLFEDVDHHTEFGVHVYGQRRGVEFVQLSHVQHPATVDGSLEHDGSGLVPGIQYPAGGWDLRPHLERVITVDEEVLASWAALFDEPGTPAEEARLLRPVTRADLAAIDVLARYPMRLAHLDYRWTAGWNETNAKTDGTMVWRTEVPPDWVEVILQGPHFTIGTPFAKNPNNPCKHNQDYTTWNLEDLPERVIPRTNYQRACDRATYDSRLDKWWDAPSTSYWRLVWRRMTQPGLERSLQGCLGLPGLLHVHTVHTLAFPNAMRTAEVAGLVCSLPYDYLIKVSGKGDVQDELVNRFPGLVDHPLQNELLLRTLRLNCLTVDYAPLWEQLFSPPWVQDGWSGAMSTRPSLGDVQPGWSMATPLRADYDRRLALVEIDALAAVMLGLTAEQLCAMYRTQFAVLRKYEYEMYFDANGRKIARDHHSYGQVQEKGDWEALQESLEQGGIDFGKYKAPFYKADREAEMTRAYEVFAARLRERAPDYEIPQAAPR